MSTVYSCMFVWLQYRRVSWSSILGWPLTSEGQLCSVLLYACVIRQWRSHSNPLVCRSIEVQAMTSQYPSIQKYIRRETCYTKIRWMFSWKVLSSESFCILFCHDKPGSDVTGRYSSARSNIASSLRHVRCLAAKVEIPLWVYPVSLASQHSTIAPFSTKIPFQGGFVPDSCPGTSLTTFEVDVVGKK
jgi:hypothetical protein